MGQGMEAFGQKFGRGLIHQGLSMSVEIPSLPDVSVEPRAAVEVNPVAEAMVQGWMDKMRKRLGTRGFMVAMAMTGAGAVESSMLSYLAGKRYLDQQHSQEASQTFRVDSGLRNVDIPPEILHEGLERIFGNLLVRDLRAIQYHDGHIPMPRHYRGSARYEAGHCTRSPGSEPSLMVLTRDNFEGHAVRASLQVVIHEAGHAVDYHNAFGRAVVIDPSTSPPAEAGVPEGVARGVHYRLSALDARRDYSRILAPDIPADGIPGMPPSIRFLLREGTHTLVEGDHQTIYAYPNDYENGSVTEAEEDAVQAEELFAEIMADGVTMRPLNPQVPEDARLLAMPVRERMTYRLATTHNISPEQARPYAEIMAAIATHRGEYFFEHAQSVFDDTVHRIERYQAAQRHERSQRQVGELLERLAIPSLSIAFRRWTQASVEQEVFDVQELVDEVEEYEEAEHRMDGDTEEDRAELRRLTDRVQRMRGLLDLDRKQYVEEQARDIFDPALRAIFIKLAGPSKQGRNPLEELRTQVSQASFRALLPEGLEELRHRVDEVNQLLWMAEHQSQATDQQKMAFREALLRWIEGEIRGDWLRRIDERYSELSDLAGELRSSDGEGGER